MSKVSITISCFVLIFVTGVAMAMPATTSQTWTFDNADNPASPTVLIQNGVCGTPVANLGTTGDPGLFDWKPEYMGRYGVWAGEPLNIELVIPNSFLDPIPPDSYKEIFLVMDFRGTVDANSFNILTNPGGCSVGLSSSSISSPDSNGWKTLTVSWLVEPNPNEETICMSVSGTGGFVDFITVDTICVPEPATLALLGLGSMVLIRRKRK